MRGDRSISGMDEKLGREGEEKREPLFPILLESGSGVVEDKMSRKVWIDLRIFVKNCYSSMKPKLFLIMINVVIFLGDE